MTETCLGITFWPSVFSLATALSERSLTAASHQVEVQMPPFYAALVIHLCFHGTTMTWDGQRWGWGGPGEWVQTEHSLCKSTENERAAANRTQLDSHWTSNQVTDQPPLGFPSVCFVSRMAGTANWDETRRQTEAATSAFVLVLKVGPLFIYTPVRIWMTGSFSLPLALQRRCWWLEPDSDSRGLNRSEETTGCVSFWYGGG